MINPYEPATEIEKAPKTEPDSDAAPSPFAKLAAITFMANGVVIAFGGATLVGTLVIFAGVLFLLGGRRSPSE